MSQNFIWFDHRSDNPSGAVKFYEELLGWTRAEKGPPGMTTFGEAGQRPWSGMAASEGIRAGWLPYSQVEDLDRSTAKAKKLGAKIVKERTRGPAGDFVVIEDPEGGSLALWEAPEGFSMD